MEQTEAFKQVETTIATITNKLLLCTNIDKVCEESVKDTEKEIEEHFARCINALAARKACLLREIAQKVANHSMHSLYIFLGL
jgi:hypothetical protein